MIDVIIATAGVNAAGGLEAGQQVGRRAAWGALERAEGMGWVFICTEKWFLQKRFLWRGPSSQMVPPAPGGKPAFLEQRAGKRSPSLAGGCS